MNCWVVPSAMLGLAGVTAKDTSDAGVTVSIVDPDFVPWVALMSALPMHFPIIIIWPGVTAVAATALNEPLISATFVFEDSQVTIVVMSLVVLSEYVPVAVSA